MGYPQTAVPETGHSVFYAYSLHANGVVFGSFERFGVKSDRPVERIREILFDRGPEIKDQVWGGVDTTLELSQVELYRKNMFAAFGLDIYALEDFNQVFTITEIMKQPKSMGGRRITEYVDCVPQSFGRDVDIGTVRVMQTMTVYVRKVQGRLES